ncbi:DNA-binding transcriptional LysR family regulator [Kibdelosporangium banguiense]|uniref:DNA-binding transcriptional LysR family regulator n=1 Tax=Kibdelosporangium banguiense TaxID=1365924 RepID=A0ABS4U2Z4_9PSEU|nr:LysR family transcriptional regulator [Kibdelosporangium banguiense]MBP2331037.1 DNA-binding transcriptional LysR family regulator [Kibdelosporangium banguiense]
MDLHLLRTFVAVARQGSFSHAAAELGYTQSAVSQHIAALESDLGATLLSRRPVAPTTVGERLLEHAGPLLLRLDAARADIVRMTAPPATRLAIGVSPLAMSPSAAAMLAPFDLTVEVLSREDVLAGVATGSFDAGLVDGIAAPTDPLNLADIRPHQTVSVAEQPVAVILPDGHPLSGRAGLRLGDLADSRWIDAPDAGIPLAQLRTMSRSDGFRASLRYTGTDVLGLVALARAGHGLTLLPQSVAGGVPISAPSLVHRVEAIGDVPWLGQA